MCMWAKSPSISAYTQYNLIDLLTQAYFNDYFYFLHYREDFTLSPAERKVT